MVTIFGYNSTSHYQISRLWLILDLVFLLLMVHVLRYTLVFLLLMVHVLRYTEPTTSVPFPSTFNLDVPVLIIPDNSDNKLCPVIIGSNVIWCLVAVQELCQLVLTALTCNSFTNQCTNRSVIKVTPCETDRQKRFGSSFRGYSRKVWLW